MEDKMSISNKFRTSNAAVCLKAIKDYIDMDEAIVSNEEQKQIKARAKKAMEHLPTIYGIETENVPVSACRGTLPVMDGSF